MAEIHRLSRVGPVLGEPPADVIECLESVLAAARRGEIRGVVIGMVEANDSTSTYTATGHAPARMMLAAATALFFRVGNHYETLMERAQNLEPPKDGA